MFVDQSIVSKNVLIIKRAGEYFQSAPFEFARNSILLRKLTTTFSNMSHFNIADDLFNGCH